MSIDIHKFSISGDIGWEVTPSDVRQNLEIAGGRPIWVTIGTRGGYVGEALDIFNMIRNYSGHKTAVYSGYVMSAGSYIAMAFDEKLSEDNAVWMMHNVQNIAYGDYREIQKAAVVSKGLSGVLAKAYAGPSGKKLDEISVLMDDETYYFGEEIVAAGFADSVIKTESEKDPQTAFSTAKLMHETFSAKMGKDQQKLKNDMNRAALALGETGPTPKPKKGDIKMDLAKLKADFPDLVTAIRAEEQTAMAGQVEAAALAGAKAERDRIKSVHDQAFPGHENLIVTAMFDGKSDGGAIAIQIIAAQRAAGATAAAAFTGDAPTAVAEPAHQGSGGGEDDMSEASLKKRWKAMSKPEQNEYATFDLFVGFVTDGKGFEKGGV